MKTAIALCSLVFCLLLNACSQSSSPQPTAWEYRAVDGRFIVGHGLVSFSRDSYAELRSFKTDPAIDKKKYGIADNEEAGLIEQVLGTMGANRFELVEIKEWPDNRFTLFFKRPAK